MRKLAMLELSGLVQVRKLALLRKKWRSQKWRNIITPALPE